MKRPTEILGSLGVLGSPGCLVTPDSPDSSGGLERRHAHVMDSHQRPPVRRRRRRRPVSEGGGLEPPPPPAPAAEPVPPVPPVPPAGRSRRHQAEQLAELDASLLTEDERTYLEARNAAELKVGLYREAVKVGLPAFFISFIPGVGPFIAAIILIFGGIKLGRRFYSAFVEPGLRRRIVEDEVQKRIKTTVQSERQQLEGQHARTLEELSASIAHEIRNPITAAKSLVQQMEEEPSADDNVEYARVALGELERVERSISHLLKYAREEDLRKNPIAMSEVLDSALETFRDRSARSGVEIVRQFDSDGALKGDAEKLRRVFINLVGNAIDALEEARVEAPRIEVALGENLAGTAVWVRIRDNGPGIDDETAHKIFNPFYTSKEGGTGLGLAITKKLVDAHAGEIELESERGVGTTFTLTFPRNGTGGEARS
ncbi:MAG: ATP-binding protein [Myxococcota bacterium]